MDMQVDVDKVLAELKAIAAEAKNEEEFKINAERVLYNEVISKLGLQPGRFEYTFVSGGRADALYGHLIIEYKAPGKLSRPQDIASAKEQLIGYIKKEAEVEGRYKLFLGVILCDRIAFVRYDPKTKDWLLRGPYDLNRESILRLIEAIRGLRRKKLRTEELLEDFGPKSATTRKAVKVLYSKLLTSKNPKVEALFNDWKRVFSQVCAYSPDKLKGLEAEYEVSNPVNYDALLFSIHTYYAFFMKLLAAEIAYLYGAGRFLKSYVAELEDAYIKGLDFLKSSLTELESGGIFKNLLNITNFIEGDYFSWYLEELDKELADALCDVAKKLSDYEPATPVLEPELTRDMLKRLYQNLVPRKIRHDLGEYYTPDWLAELVLNEVGLTLENFEKLAKEKGDNLAPLSLRILDPACGSGTFLVLAIKRLKEYAEEHYLRDITPNYIFKNVVGFDLNPLAVLAARTNYLLVMADMLSYAKGPVEIPVYLADSLLVEAKSTLKGEMYVIRTYVEEFELPRSIVERGLLNKLLGAIDRYVRLKYKPEEFKQIAEREIGLSGEELDDVKELYGKFLRLEEEKKNHVWVSVIRNAFAPLVLTSQEKFDYVIGNPPWINWENLPGLYRDSTKQLWDDYGLLKRTKGAALGKVKKDIAMLFAARCLDRFTKDGGRLSFLVPFTVYKTQAGAGFREFLASGTMRGKIRCPCKVLKIHDLVTLYPFEGAVNRTSLIVIEKSERTEFPIECVVWYNPRSRGIDQEAELEEVRRINKQFNMKFLPIEKDKPRSPWMQITDKAYEGIKKVIGSSPWYRAHAGVYTGLNQVYWIKITSELPDGLLITNPPLPGQKKTVKQVEQIVEKELVYPLIRGRDVKRWYVAGGYGWIIIPHNPETGDPIKESEIKINFPKAYGYFSNFKKELESRSIHKLWGKGNPFYSVYDIGDYTFYPYKVVWKRIAGAITGKAISFASAVLEPVKAEFLGNRPVILNDSLILIPFKNGEEAYYVAGVLNSSIALLTIASYTYELRQETHITQYIKIPEFDSKNSLHERLSQLSRKAHEIAKKIYEENREDLKEDLSKIEEEIDKTVAQLYGITDEELDEIRKCLAVLKEGEISEEEEEITEEPEEIKVDFLNTVVKPNAIGVVEISVINPLKDKLIIEVGPPSIPAKLETSKEEDKFHIKIQPLEAGEYEVPYKVITSKGVIEGKFTLYVKEEERRRTRDLLSSKIDELLGEET